MSSRQWLEPGALFQTAFTDATVATLRAEVCLGKAAEQLNSSGSHSHTPQLLASCPATSSWRMFSVLSFLSTVYLRSAGVCNIYIYVTTKQLDPGGCSSSPQCFSSWRITPVDRCRARMSRWIPVFDTSLQRLVQLVNDSSAFTAATVAQLGAGVCLDKDIVQLDSSRSQALLLELLHLFILNLKKYLFH